jgi:hypothetical protein
MYNNVTLQPSCPAVKETRKSYERLPTECLVSLYEQSIVAFKIGPLLAKKVFPTLGLITCSASSIPSLYLAARSSSVSDTARIDKQLRAVSSLF